MSERAVAAVKPPPGTYWVEPERLLAGAYPGHVDPAYAEARVAALLALGFDWFLDLTWPGELPPYQQLLPGRRDPGYPRPVIYSRRPIRDHDLPRSRRQMAAILDELAEALGDGRRVYLHCRAGIGRTGTVAGCHLARRLGSGAAALAALDRLWFLAFTYGVYLIPWAVIAVPQMAAAIAVAFLPLKTAFVSYRRVDGRNVAVFITSELNHLGIEAFMDIKEHTAGRLDTILFAQIAHRENFILILTPGLIERWRPGEGAENDWIGQEIERAVQLKKTVIPVPVDDFGRFLEQYRTLQNKAVPAGVQTVFATYKRSSYSSDQPDASVEAIARNLKSGFRRF